VIRSPIEQEAEGCLRDENERHQKLTEFAHFG
jgi:hypothetical protein